MWAPQQAARVRQRASFASNRRRGRRIRYGRLRTHYRGYVRGSSHAGAGHNGRLTVDRTANQGQKPAKDDGSPAFLEIGRHFGCGTSRRWRAATWNRDLPESNQSAKRHRINFTRFRRDACGEHGETSPQGSVLAARMPCRLLGRVRVIETIRPGKARLNAGYGISAAREQCAQSARVSKWPRRNLNLPLAAGPCVRHIRAHGAVAEWLKAAVC